ncbi:hypothetical protein JOY44_24205 [Phormidium sp. CLA17]|uniref:hypothetical protein n=1 Tax=Leptolyngbya sp. Cla-17 TaxID=2803751 RepID=UPI001491CC33|nr:hypothetical protein [Leptolyngbya sp. Cla-17]MBM0744671.1 hypothetical protein [Leptolyngbya sp. Cla-17]
MQVFVALLLGAVGQLFLVSVVVLELGIFIFGTALFLSVKKRLTLASFRDTFKLEERLTKAEILIITSILLAAIILVVKLATEVIINYDSLWYHLPTMARWYQEGKFVSLDEFSRTGEWATDAIAYYPFNWEILCTLFVMPFREDFLVTLPNLISWFILGLSVYLLSTKVGAERIYSIAAAALVLTIPLIIQHVNSLHIDLPFAAFFLTSLYFAISYSQNRSFVDLSSFFIAIFMLLGIKLSSIGYAVLPITIFLFLEIRNTFLYKVSFKDVLNQSRLAIPTIVVSILGALFIGFYWYLKNFIEAGNPLGDIKISLAGVLLSPGSMELSTLQQTSLANLFHFTDLSHWKIMVLQAIVRLQVPFLALVFQALLLPKLLLPKQRFTYAPLLFSLCCFVLVGTGYLYWKTPFTGTNLLPPLPPQPINQYIGQQARFAMPFMGMLGVIAAVTASSLRTSSYLVAAVVFVSSLLGIVSSTVFDIIRVSTAFRGGVGWASAILDGFRSNPTTAVDQLLKIVSSNLINVLIYILIYVIAFVLLVWGASRSRVNRILAAKASQLFNRPNRFAIISILLGLLVITSWGAREARDIHRKEVYGGVYEYIAGNLKPTETLGYLLSYRSYFFYGKHWEQKVLYVPSRSESLSQWVDDLKQQQVSGVAVGPLEEKMGWQPREVRWLENPAGHFTLVFGQDPKKEPTIYRLQNGQGG